MPAVKPERLVVPPKKWRGSASLRGYAEWLLTEIGSADRVFAMSHDPDHRRVVLSSRTAEALLEIICQAIHTEQGHGS